jgi:hypothetical protein
MHTFVYARKGYTWLERWPRRWQVLHSLYYTTVICFPLLVSLVFWVSMYTGLTLTFDKWSTVSIYGLNSLFALLEIILLRMIILHFGCLCVILSLYLALIYISYAMAHVYPYEWYDPRAGWRIYLSTLWVTQQRSSLCFTSSSL